MTTRKEALAHIEQFAFLAISDATSLVNAIFDYVERVELENRLYKECGQRYDKLNSDMDLLFNENKSLEAKIAELEANAKKEVQTIRKGQIFLTQTHGRVVFEGLDFYGGECTAKLRGVDHSGTFYPKLETLPYFQFIDN